MSAQGQAEEITRLMRRVAELKDEASRAERYRLAWTSARRRAEEHVLTMADVLAERDEARSELSDMIERCARKEMELDEARADAVTNGQAAERLAGELAEMRAEVTRLGRAFDGSRLAVDSLSDELLKAQNELESWRTAFGDDALDVRTAQLRAALAEERIEPEPPADRYMMATTATHVLDDISRDEPNLAIVYGETDDDFIGEWATGVGFINVRFPKATTGALTEDERQFYGAKVLDVAGRVVRIQLDSPGTDGGSE